jgi:geranylgeranyl diphosphate synthase, type I
MAKASSSATKNPFLSLLTDVAERLEPRLSAVLDESEARAHGYGEEVGDMVGTVRSLCERGGKRLRPGLCVVGALSRDERASWDPAIEAGVALELLQAYFLIHDDWMDQDDERRGGPTAHIELARRFRSKEIGAAGAILAGDHAVALASYHLTTIPTSAARLKKCHLQFAEMQLAAVAGQMLDIRGKTPDPELTYELKTASYTVRGPLLLGAEIAGASAKTIQALDHYSLPTGIAFQLRDDLIGVFQDPEISGKPQGGDLKEGKNTSLVYAGRKMLSPAGRKVLDRVLGNRRATAKQVVAAISALEDCGARSAIEERIEILKAEATASLNTSALSKKSKTLLAGAIVALADRKM